MKQTRIRKTSKVRAGVKRADSKLLLGLWKVLIRNRDGFRCQWPGCTSTSYLQCHHVFSSAIHSLRFDPDNGVLLCRGHHFSVAHHRSGVFWEWWKERVGPAVSSRLELISNMRTKTKLDPEAMRIFLEDEIDKLQYTSSD